MFLVLAVRGAGRRCASLVETRQHTGTEGAPVAASPGIPGLLVHLGLVRGLGTLRSQLTLQLMEPSPPTPLFLGGTGQLPPPLPVSTKGKACPPGHLCFLGSGKTVTPELSSQPGSHTLGRGLTPPRESRRALWTKCPTRGRRWGWVTFKDGDLGR